MMSKKYSLLFTILLSANFLQGAMIIDTSFDPDKGFEKSIDVVPEKPKSVTVFTLGDQSTASANEDSGINQDLDFRNDNLDQPNEPEKSVSSSDADVLKEAPKDGYKKEGSEIDYQGKSDMFKNEAALKSDVAPASSAYYGDSLKEFSENQVVAGSDKNSEEAEDAGDMTTMLAAGAAAAAVGVGALGIALAKGDLDKYGDKAKDIVEGKGGRTDYKSGLVKQKLQKNKILKEEEKLKQLSAERTALDEKSRNATDDEKKDLDKQLMDKRKKETESLDRMKTFKEKKALIDKDVEKNKAKLEKNLEKKKSGTSQDKMSQYKEKAKQKAEAKQLAKDKSLKTAVKSKLPSLPKVKRPF